MDAVKFIEERRRMFAVTGENSKYSLFNMNTPAQDVVKEVEEWSAAHPRKTRQSVFLEQYPEAKVIEGVLNICPKDLLKKFRNGSICYNPYSNSCASCRREFWTQEVE